ncbi:hypothetical protein DEM27_28705 [Metarhizobium album]|uniref:Uncharacterized protein n=1 Tax=Metarhizobium album TaxID=2182425 RepID=A0A2U2DHI2_9HYPH|nr:hypothetical protein [Rhizobium album]PWE52785.1 hypothetical protein DEM27_28705 [Rhizobium album]
MATAAGWSELEFGMTVQTAGNFMRVSERFGAEMKTVFNLPASVLYALAFPSTGDADLHLP